MILEQKRTVKAPPSRSDIAASLAFRGRPENVGAREVPGVVRRAKRRPALKDLEAATTLLVLRRRGVATEARRRRKELLQTMRVRKALAREIVSLSKCRPAPAVCAAEASASSPVGAVIQGTAELEEMASTASGCSSSTDQEEISSAGGASSSSSGVVPRVGKKQH